jgi:uncharacterized protein YndB with AHSA1/START domain
MPHTIRLHRVLKAPPERIYRAFIDPAAVAKWNAPDGFTAVVHEMDAHVGGRYRTSFINFANGETHSFGGEYHALVPGERIVVSDRFDDPNLPGEMVTTVALRAVSCGTELSITQEGLPDVVPPEMCYLGWQQSLELLARLVETAPPAEMP